MFTLEAITHKLGDHQKRDHKIKAICENYISKQELRENLRYLITEEYL